MIEAVKIGFPYNSSKTTYLGSLCAKSQSAHKPPSLCAKLKFYYIFVYNFYEKHVKKKLFLGFLH